MAAPITVQARSIVGRVRKNNEDRLFVADAALFGTDKGLLVVVADGMGGHAAGEIASQLAVDIVPARYYADTRCDMAALVDAIADANQAITERQRADPAVADMGSTLVAAIVHPDRVIVAHLGDSRCYLRRGASLTVLTRDHTLGNETPGLPSTSPLARTITRSLGQPDGPPEVEVHEHALLPGDRLLLCSDGLWGALSEKALAMALGGSEPAHTLVGLADQAGGHDNITAIVAVLEGQGEAHPVLAPPTVSRQARSSGANRTPVWRGLTLGLVAGAALLGCLSVGALLALRAFTPLAPDPTGVPTRVVAGLTSSPAAAKPTVTAVVVEATQVPRATAAGQGPASTGALAQVTAVPTAEPTRSPTPLPQATSTLAPPPTATPPPTMAPTRTPVPAAGPVKPTPVVPAARVTLGSGTIPTARPPAGSDPVFNYAKEQAVFLTWDRALSIGARIRIEWQIDGTPVTVADFCTFTVRGCVDVRLQSNQLRMAFTDFPPRAPPVGNYRYTIFANDKIVVQGSFTIQSK